MYPPLMLSILILVGSTIGTAAGILGFHIIDMLFLQGN